MSSIKKAVRAIVPKKAVRIFEKTYRTGRGLAWQVRYGFPARSMHVIAVTGTNGKTTTASYINSILKAGGYKTAVSTTAFREIDGQFEPSPTTFTLEKQSELQKFFVQAKEARVDWVILEVTSHALDQDRIMGVPVEIAVLTNLTQDHLDYHKTMDEYAAVKARLFGKEYDPKFSILNRDDPRYNFFASKASGEVLSYGLSKTAEVHVTNSDLSPEGSAVTARYHKQQLAFTTHLVGLFNVYNALAAVSVGLALKLEPQVIAKGISDLKAVPGRMERIDEGQPFEVLVDYAVTPDALKNALSTLQQIAKKRVVVVFGATGDRDMQKRPLMGEVAAENADLIFLTDDETYTEDPESIRQAVYEGIGRKAGESKTMVIGDRLEAIKAAFAAAEKSDIVLLTGMGHENTRNMGGKKIPWDERQIARELLGSLAHKKVI